MLWVNHISKNFGGLNALKDVDFKVEPGEIFGLIGPNGAGKTTLFNVISGVFRPSEGKIFYKEKDITALPLHRVAGKGLVRTFQQTELFMEMTTFENLLVAQRLSTDRTASTWFRRRRKEVKIKAKREQFAMEILEFTGLLPWKDNLAVNLAHGFRRMLGVAIALGVRPDLLLLDEPLTGMDAEEIRAMVKMIKQLREKGTTIMLVEHNMRAVMSLCDRIFVLNFGKKIAEGAPQEVQNNKHVIDAYLGVEDTIEDVSFS